jgi:Winged helix DNA-binding domain
MRLRASRLTGTPFTSPAEAVGWHLAMQAQEYGPATWSIGQRSKGLVGADIDRAVHDGSIVRTHVLRPTWHFVAAEDLRWLLALSGPRVHAWSASRYRDLGLDARTRARGERLIVEALSGGRRLTRKQLAAELDGRRFDREGQRMAYLLMHCELEGVIGSGGLAGKQQTYALLDGRIPPGPSIDRDEALVRLVRRYLQSHGPATLKDMSWWSGLTMGDLRRGLGQLGGEVRGDEAGGITLWSLSDPGRPSAPRAAHLLQTYDELVVGYTESRFAGDPDGHRAAEAWRDRTLPTGILLIGERLAGHWRRTVGRTEIDLRVHLYDDPAPAARKAVQAEARRFERFFGLPVRLETVRWRPT